MDGRTDRTFDSKYHTYSIASRGQALDAFVDQVVMAFPFPRSTKWTFIVHSISCSFHRMSLYCQRPFICVFSWSRQKQSKKASQV